MKKKYTITRFFRFDQKTDQTLREKSLLAGMNQSEYVRVAIQSSTICPRSNSDDLRQLSWEINKVGVNLNQIAHALNGEFYDPYYDAQKAEAAYADLKEISDRINLLIVDMEGK